MRGTCRIWIHLERQPGQVKQDYVASNAFAYELESESGMYGKSKRQKMQKPLSGYFMTLNCRYMSCLVPPQQQLKMSIICLRKSRHLAQSRRCRSDCKYAATAFIELTRLVTLHQIAKIAFNPANTVWPPQTNVYMLLSMVHV